MRVNIVLPFIGKTGGIVVALEHARGLRALGHDVAVYYPLLPYREFLFEVKSLWRKWILWQAKPLLGNLVRFRRRVAWTGYNAPVIPVPIITNLFLRDADVVIATAWPTAYSVASLSQRKGRKLYFIQHYEIWSSDPLLVDASYRLPVNLITIAPWLTELMREKFHRKVVAEIHNGIDLEAFRPPSERDWSRPSILMMHHELEWKGSGVGLAALERIHAAHPDVPIRLFGMSPFPGAPPWVEYHHDPPRERILSLYQSSHIFVSPSLKEGWHLPPMEAMACGCALVATPVGCIPVLQTKDNMLVVEPNNPGALADALDGLLRDSKRARVMAGNGLRTISEYTWERATRHLAQIFQTESPE